jgi:hypothetical protein
MNKRKSVYTMDQHSGALMPRQRGIPADWDEIKERHNVMVGPTAWDNLKAIALELGYKSRSDLIEAIGRREVTCIKPGREADSE